MSSNIRTRFAPSPTGFFHIGSARTALFNWLYARHTGGTFILRVEDTDTARNSEEYLRVIYDSLRWLGMDWDEGPGDAGGNHGPYRQSERTEIYHEYLQKLLATGRAYKKDGATWLRLEGPRRTIRETYKDGETTLDRQVEVVDAAPVVIHDLIRSDVTRAEDRDFVLVRANGEPGFHFVNVVDDITMGITHVIRGEDHLSNTSKHIELYKAFGAAPPTFAHIPLILKTEGKGKMSKRDRGALIEEYQQRHFLPDAVRNYLCLLGWTPKDGREILPIADIIAQFDLPDVHQGNARFDERKMTHVNQQYLRALPPAEIDRRATEILRTAGLLTDATPPAFLQDVLNLIREKITGFENIPTLAGYFFTDAYTPDSKALEALQKKGDPRAKIAALLPPLEALAQTGNLSDPAALESTLNAAALATNDKPANYFAALRYATTGLNGGPHLHEIFRLLPPQTLLPRLHRFLGE